MVKLKTNPLMNAYSSAECPVSDPIIFCGSMSVSKHCDCLRVRLVEIANRGEVEHCIDLVVLKYLSAEVVYIPVVKKPYRLNQADPATVRE